jgi:tetratricopeptide (TPR) repeat protein
MNRKQRRATAKLGPTASNSPGATPGAVVATEVAEFMGTGLKHHQAGRLAEAEACYRHVLAGQPNHADALHLLGVVAHQTGRHDLAIELIGQAIKRNGRNPNYLYNLGVTLQDHGKPAEAVAAYREAIRIKPDYAEAFKNQGDALRELRRLEEALASYQKALAFRPVYAEACNNRGVVLRELGRLEEALASYDTALAFRPDYAEALNNRGNALKDLKRPAEALSAYDKVLALRPGHAEACNNRGVALQELKRPAEALGSYDQALALRPDYAEALNNRGNALKELDRLDEALSSFDRALVLAPRHAEAFYNRGNALQELWRPDEALASFDRALALKPDHAEACNNRGNALRELKRFDEALASSERALALRPDYAPAHWNEALYRLLMGDFERGWEKYEWRWALADALWGFVSTPAFAQPAWDGTEDVGGKTILLHAEQGLGDTIQFCRYVPLVAEKGANVILAVQPSLKRLLTGFAEVQAVVGQDEEQPAFDLHCPLLSLPRAFRTRLETIPPPHAPGVPPELTKAWEARLRRDGTPRVGIVWSGRQTHKHGRHRSIPLRAMLGLLDLPIELVSLQKEVHGDDQGVLDAHAADIAHFGPALTDFMETAALVSLMDVVITIDTAVAHLACSLGRPTWILLPFVPDWRWLLEREDSPWYPTARLFRQPAIGDWNTVMQEVVGGLRQRFQPAM